MAQVMYNTDFDWQDDQQNKVFLRLITVLFTIAVICGYFIAVTELPPLTRAEKEQLPPQLLRIVERKKAEPPPVVEQPQVKPEEVEQVEQPPEQQEEKTVKPQPTKDEVAKARQKASKTGLLALSNELQAMRSSLQLDGLNDSASMSGNDVASSSGAEAADDGGILADLALQNSGYGEGDLLSSSDNIRIGSSRRDILAATAGDGLSDKAVTAISEVATNDQQLAGLNSEDMAVSEQPMDSSATAGQQAFRSTEAIRQVFDQNKGALYAIYRRALRQDPNLQGKVTFDLIIEPDGSVSSIKLVLSELESPELENKLMTRIRMINFGEEGTNATQLNYTFNFLPF